VNVLPDILRQEIQWQIAWKAGKRVNLKEGGRNIEPNEREKEAHLHDWFARVFKDCVSAEAASFPMHICDCQTP
jgi:hypothetical protein